MRRLNPIDLSVYFVLSPDQWGERDPAALVRAAVAGSGGGDGATLVQLRDKRADTRATLDAARALKAALAGTGVPLIVNDRVDVALAAGADGVNLGAADMPAADARRLLGPDAVVGVTVKTEAEADAVDPAVVDYASVGGVFATASKHNPEPPIGLDGLRDRVARVRARAPAMPVSAIAGIDTDSAAAAIAAGADGVAVIRAIAEAADPGAAAARLRGIVADARRQRTETPA